MTLTRTALKNLALLGFSAYTLGFAFIASQALENQEAKADFLVQAECSAEEALESLEAKDI